MPHSPQGLIWKPVYFYLKFAKMLKGILVLNSVGVTCNDNDQKAETEDGCEFESQEGEGRD